MSFIVEFDSKSFLENEELQSLVILLTSVRYGGHRHVNSNNEPIVSLFATDDQIRCYIMREGVNIIPLQYNTSEKMYALPQVAASIAATIKGSGAYTPVPLRIHVEKVEGEDWDDARLNNRLLINELKHYDLIELVDDYPCSADLYIRTTVTGRHSYRYEMNGVNHHFPKGPLPDVLGIVIDSYYEKHYGPLWPRRPNPKKLEPGQRVWKIRGVDDTDLALGLVNAIHGYNDLVVHSATTHEPNVHLDMSNPDHIQLTYKGKIVRVDITDVDPNLTVAWRIIKTAYKELISIDTTEEEEEKLPKHNPTWFIVDTCEHAHGDKHRIAIVSQLQKELQVRGLVARVATGADRYVICGQRIYFREDGSWGVQSNDPGSMLFSADNTPAFVAQMVKSFVQAKYKYAPLSKERTFSAVDNDSLSVFYSVAVVRSITKDTNAVYVEDDKTAQVLISYEKDSGWFVITEDKSRLIVRDAIELITHLRRLYALNYSLQDYIVLLRGEYGVPD